MTEPTYSISHIFAAMAMAAAGYVSGDYVSILFGAVAGSLWPLSNASTKTRAEGALLVFKLVATALALTSFAAWMLERSQDIPAARTLAPIAFLIAVLGNSWIRIFDAAGSAITSSVEAIGKGMAKKVAAFFGVDK